MSFSLESGYTPRDFDTIVSEFRQNINEEYKQNLTADQFKGSNWYKLIYSAAQLIATAEGNTAELANKLIDYINKVNEEILLPKSSVDGVMYHLKKDLGLISSVKPTEEADRGYFYIAVDVDNESPDYAQTKQNILAKLMKYCTGGLYFKGSESGQVIASNGQPFTFGYELPTIVDMWVRITPTISDNTTAFIQNSSQIKEKFLENFNSMYKLGLDFEPEKYLDIRNDLPFASQIKIEWSINEGSSWSEEVWKSAYNQKLNLSNVEVVI